MLRWDILDSVARRQYGLIAHWQLLENGFTPHGIQSLITSGRLIRVRRTVYRLCGSQVSWNVSVLAAVLAIGKGTVASHTTAGAIWALIDQPTDRIEVTSARYHRLEGLLSHRHSLEPWETTSHQHIPVTTVERTLLDLAETNDGRSLGKAVDIALRRRLTTLGRLESITQRCAKPGRRRSRALVQALAERGVGYDPGSNDWELRMDRLWEEMGLPPAERQYRIRVAGRPYRVDRAIPSRRIGIEWNGYSSHGTRSSFDSDAERKSRLISAGWCILEFTPASPPAFIGHTVLAVYNERSPLEECG